MEDLKTYAKQKNIKLIGDLPFMFPETGTHGVIDHYSQFLKTVILLSQSGVPPDYFSSTVNYGGPQLTFGQDIRGLISICGEKDLKDNLSLLTY